MPNKKNKYFSKNNSVKLLLLHGKKEAINADGECLKNVLVPVSKNYKPGSSLIINRITELVNESNPPAPSTSGIDLYDIEDEGNLKDIVGRFDDSTDSEDETPNENIEKKLKNLNISDVTKRLKDADFTVEEIEDDSEDYDFYDDESDFSDESSTECSPVRKNCPETLKILEEQTKKKLEEYDDDQVGALDDEEIGGHLNFEKLLLNKYLPEFDDEDKDVEFDIGNYEQSFKDQILKYAEEEHVENMVEVVTEQKIEYDCESILSTYSNKYNHPTIIKEAGKIRKIKIPANPLKSRLTKSRLKQLDEESEESDSDDNFSVVSSMNSRPKGETPEQRRERKHLFKEAKKESRILKKENKLAFKNEKKVQNVQIMNAQNNRGKRIN